METLGYDNVFIGTVEGEPEDTACEAVSYTHLDVYKRQL